MATKTSTKNKSKLAGTAAADVLTVKHDQVTVTGAGGNDTIKITKGNSSNVSGGAGKDTITVSAGKSHTIHENAANDTITIGRSAGTGIKVYGDTGNDTIKAANSYAATFYGGDGSDTLTGGKGGDKLYGQAGADKLYGGAGSDYLYGGDAADKLYGQDGADKLYGQNGNDYLYGGNGNDTLSGGAGDDRLYGQAGTDTLTGGAGKDTFVYANGGGSDKITDYAAGSDTLQISSGSISKMALANSSKDIVITVGKGKVTLKNAAGKTIRMKDSRGSYTMSKSAITLGSNFAGTMDSAKYLSTVTTVNGKSSAKTVTIKGNAKANTVYGGSGVNTIYGNAGNDKLYGYAGNDTLSGGDGNDTLYGGAGNDMLTGGAGKDTFVYANGEGSDIIKDYAAGQDTLQISSGSISKATLANSNKDLVFTIGSGKVTLTGAATKAISLKDSRGNYTASSTAIKLASNFTGTMNATKYLASVKTIDGRNATKAVNITGNAQNNTIYAGKAGGTINGGAGNDTLYGGAGKDTFVYATGNETIYNYASGSDTIKLSSTKLKSSTISGNDAILNLANGCKITVKNAANADVLVVDSAGKSLTINNSNAAGGSTAYGSDGTDTFVYNAGEGNATIKDYKEGEDILQIADGEIIKTEIVDGNVVLTVGNNGNTITLEGAAGKNIEVHNNNGSFTLSEEEISLGTDYTGDIDANAYLPTVTTIDGRNAEGSVNITGNAQNNSIYAGKAGGTLNGGAGNDTLYGGAGADTFVYANGDGSDIIKNFEENQDTLKVTGNAVSNANIADANMVLTVGSGSVTLEGASEKTLQLQDTRGSYSVSADKITLGTDFTGELDAGTFMPTAETIDGSAAEGTVNITGNAQDNIIYAGKAGGTINGGAGNDTLYGGAGNDTFVYVAGGGSDTIKAYVEDQDILKIESASISNAVFTDNNAVFTIGDGSVTVEGGADKNITIQNNNGSFTVSGTEIKIGSDYTGVMEAEFLSTATKIDGSAAEETISIVGNAQDNSIYAGKSGGTYKGGIGDDTLYSGAGDDMLYGGAGQDTFVYATGNGNDIIKDYREGQDLLKISAGMISGTMTNDGNLVLEVGSGSLTLENVLDKTIQISDSNGDFSVSSEQIILGSNYKGTMDTDIYHESITTVDGRASVEEISIIGNAQDNIIYAGKAGGTLTGGVGNDTLYGGDGNDTFVYDGKGNDVIKNYDEGKDVLKITNGTIASTEFGGKYVRFYIGEGSVTLEGAADKNITIQDKNGSLAVSRTSIVLGSDYSGTMDANLYSSPTELLATIDGSAATNIVNITGNAKDNTIYAGQAGGTISGGKGTNILYGGSGQDIFVIPEGGGSSTVNNYTEGEDIIKVDNIEFGTGITIAQWRGAPNNYSIARKILLGNSRESSYIYIDDSVKTLDFIDISGERATLNVIAGKTDYQPYSPNTIKGGDEAEMIIGGWGNDDIYGRDGDDYIYGGGTTTGSDNLYGEAGNDILCAYGASKICGGPGNDILYGSYNLYGGEGDDILWTDNSCKDDVFLYGEEGKDTFVFGKVSNKRSYVNDYEVGEDIIKFTDGVSDSSSSISGNNVVLNLSNSGKVTIANGVGKSITFDYGNGNLENRVFQN